MLQSLLHNARRIVDIREIQSSFGGSLCKSQYSQDRAESMHILLQLAGASPMMTIICALYNMSMRPAFRRRNAREEEAISYSIKSNVTDTQLVQTCAAAKSSKKKRGNGLGVEQNEREMPNEKSNPLKSCLRRASCYLTGSDSDPVHFCFQEVLGFRAWLFTRLLAQRPVRLMGRIDAPL
jgi:hypothetical protein